MSYDPSDAAYDRFVDELYKEFSDSALEGSELYGSLASTFMIRCVCVDCASALHLEHVV